jgi:hypothetical protein
MSTLKGYLKKLRKKSVNFFSNTDNERSKSTIVEDDRTSITPSSSVSSELEGTVLKVAKKLHLIPTSDFIEAARSTCSYLTLLSTDKVFYTFSTLKFTISISQSTDLAIPSTFEA